MATKFAIVSTTYEQLDAMFQLVKELQPQVLDAHKLPQMLGKHCSSIC